ncbi:hypothetical protein SEPCBS119000_006662 [Sporothrix epigloea]|uniref:Uncharacterized protein n=1 Tax=Sporothrix epigloea TaxID=1892477 RepID=A0ABP0E459_9PEZI
MFDLGLAKVYTAGGSQDKVQENVNAGLMNGHHRAKGTTSAGRTDPTEEDDENSPQFQHSLTSSFESSLLGQRVQVLSLPSVQQQKMLQDTRIDVSLDDVSSVIEQFDEPDDTTSEYDDSRTGRLQSAKRKRQRATVFHHE